MVRNLAVTIWTLISLGINKTMGYQLPLCLLRWCNQYTATSLKCYHTRSPEFQIVAEFKNKFKIPQRIKDQIIGHLAKATSKVQAIGHFTFSSKCQCDMQTLFGHLFKKNLDKKRFFEATRSIQSKVWFLQTSCMDMRVGPQRKLSAKELMLLNCGAGTWEPLGLQGEPTSPS